MLQRWLVRSSLANNMVCIITLQITILRVEGPRDISFCFINHEP